MRHDSKEHMLARRKWPLSLQHRVCSCKPIGLHLMFSAALLRLVSADTNTPSRKSREREELETSSSNASVARGCAIVTSSIIARAAMHAVSGVGEGVVWIRAASRSTRSRRASGEGLLSEPLSSRVAATTSSRCASLISGALRDRAVDETGDAARDAPLAAMPVNVELRTFCSPALSRRCLERLIKRALRHHYDKS